MRNVLDSPPGGPRWPARTVARTAEPAPARAASLAAVASGAARLAAAAADAAAAGAGTTAARIARRHALKAAVVGARGKAARRDRPRSAAASQPAQPAQGMRGTVSGVILDVSPHVLVIGCAEAEDRLALPAGAHAWRGARTDPAALRVGDQVIARRHPPGRDVADRIWANIGRVTGIIASRDRGTLTVDGGGGTRRLLVIPPAAAGQIQVRFPRLEPGFLIDVIGLDRGDHLEGLIPATSQPAYRADHAPGPPLVSGHVPGSISGAAVWHDRAGADGGRIAGVGYPAVDPRPAPAVTGPSPPPGCVRLPYLSVGSLLRVRNDCTGLSGVLPVTGDTSTARLFCDRSVACGPSPRGRIADLTVAGFVALGGELDAGSFNVTIEIGD